MRFVPWAVLVLYAFLTAQRVAVFRDNRALWTDAVATAPCSARAHWNLSQTLTGEDARHAVQTAIEIARGDRCGH